MGNPINQKNNKINISGKGIKWDGPNIACLDLCTGDSVTSVVYKLAQKVCDLVENFEDLSTLDLECVIDLCSDCPEDYSLKTILQLLLDNDCKIQELITSIENQIKNQSNGGLVLSLNLKCIEEELTKICRDITDYTINDLLQALINIICDHDAFIIETSSKILALEQLICSLQDAVVAGTYEEPELTFNCSSDPDDGFTAQHSEFTEFLSDKVCSLQELVGTESDVTDALSQACLDIYPLSDTIQFPQNLAQDEKNKWLLLCALAEKVKNLETGCCAPSCDDIKIGFSALYDEGTNEFTFVFNNGTGTTIPSGFLDCGSTLTMSDQHGNTISGVAIDPPYGITNNTTFTTSAGSLFVTDPITVKINTCFSHTNGLECVDCFTQTVPVQDLGCKVCKLCAENGSTGDEIKIQYHTISNPTVQSIVLTQGACLTFDLPDDAPIVDSVIVLTSGSSISIEASENCDENLIIPTPIQDTCWFFPLPTPHAVVDFSVEGNNCGLPGSDAFFTISSINTHVWEYKEIETDNGTIPFIGKTCLLTDLVPGASASSGYIISLAAVIGGTFTSGYIISDSPSGNIQYTVSQESLNTCSGFVGQVDGTSVVPTILSSNFGIGIKLLGQTTVPHLIITDPITNQDISIKGQLQSC